MTPDGLTIVQDRLSLLATMASTNPLFVPLFHTTSIACAVDTELRVHAVRTSAPLTTGGVVGAGEMRPVEAAVIAGNGAEPRFSPITPPLFEPAYPVMAPRGGGYAVAFRALAGRSESAVKLRAFDAMLTDTNGTRTVVPISVMDRVSFALRVATAPSGITYVLGQDWFPPAASPGSIPLWIVAVCDGEVKTLAQPIRGTDMPGSRPFDVALHASADSLVHIVYDGVRTVPRSPPWRYHLILDANGSIVETHALGAAVGEAVRTAIVPSSSGELFYAALSRRHDRPGELEHTITKLQAGDVAGAHQHFVVDPWLRAHVVWHDAVGAHFDGPKTVPQKA